LPATCSIWQLDDAIACARRSADPASVIVVLFHEYDFREVNQERGRVTYNGFTQILERLSQQEDIEVQPIGRIQNAFARRYTENQGIAQIHRFLPPLLPAKPYPLVYWSVETSRKVRLRQRTLLASLYGSWVLAVCALSVYVSRVVLSKMPGTISKVLLLSGVPLLLLCGSLWTVRDGQLGWRGLTAVVGFLAYAASTLSSTLWHRYRRAMNDP